MRRRFTYAFVLSSEFLLHFLLKEKGVDEFRDEDLIFFGEFGDAVKLIDQSFTPNWSKYVI